MRRRQPSLKRRLIVQPLMLHLAVLLLFFVAISAWLMRAVDGGAYADDAVTAIAAQAVVRDADGNLRVRMTRDLAEARAEVPELWFIAVDDMGYRAAFGPVPPQYEALNGALANLSFADLRGQSPPYHLSAALRREHGPAGRLTILAHGGILSITFALLALSNIFMLPILLLLVLVSVIATPWIVRRSLASVAKIAREAEMIDFDRRGARLSDEEAPREIVPLIEAVNGALLRLDVGYQRHRRFIADAAHELRTPIAILRIKIDTDAAAGRLLGRDVARLSNLAEQLLDLQRLDYDAPIEPIDLASLAQRVAADLAPLVIASDREIEVLIDDPIPVIGNPGAIERVVVNLVQNAIEHGGARATIRVSGRTIEVEDDGPGIPADERDRVFEPFHRLRPRSSGTGLGLALVRQVMERHHGRVVIDDAPEGGARVRIEFPAP